MIRLIERTSDRLLGLVVPKMAAQADPCIHCSPGRIAWGSVCFCLRGWWWKHQQQCGANGCYWQDNGCQPYGYVGC